MDLLLAVTLRALMRHDIWMKFQHILGEDAFSNPTAATLFYLIGVLHKANNKNITERSLRVAVEAHIKAADRRQELNQAITSIMEVKKRDLTGFDTAIRRYLARGYAEQALFHYYAHRDDPGFDYTVPAALMERAQGIIQVSDEPTLAARRVGLPGDVDMARHAVRLGFSRELDASLLGGIGCGELGIILAPPARGKTSYLIGAAANAVKDGNHVLYFTLEIAKWKVFTRYYQTLTSMTYTEMIKAREIVDIARNDVAGELYVADYSKARLTPSLVHAEVEMLRNRDVNVSYVIIDYAELMDPTGGFGRLGANSRTLGDMAKDLRRVAAYFNIPILSAWQVNRGGHDKIVFNEGDVSECWEIVKHADIILGLNQGTQDAASNIMRVKVLKQRESPARPLCYLHSDMTRNVIKALANTEVDYGEHVAGKDDTSLERGGGPGVQMYRPGAVGRQQAGGSSGGDLPGRTPAPAPDVANGPLVTDHNPSVG